MGTTEEIIEEEVPEKPKLEYAGFMQRSFAHMLDALLLLFIASMLSFLYVDVQEMRATQIMIKEHFADNEINLQDLMQIFSALIFNSKTLIEMIAMMVFCVFFWQFMGATPGKVIMRIMIIDEKSLQKPSPLMSFVRYLGYILSALPFCIGFIWMTWDKKRRCFHDMISGTIVVRKGSLNKHFKKLEENKKNEMD